ncbi:hypothetical protein MYX84_15160, partial [Acidobacteria bacterium AH-259-O06]|nr:hypothetical protein [Acidobacteria bacterium AH-259-O06]
CGGQPLLAVPAVSRGAMPPGLTFALLLWWSSPELPSIHPAGALLPFAGLSLAQSAQVSREQCQGNGFVAVWTVDHHS